MSDEYYRQRAAQRARIWWILGGVALALACLYLGITTLFRDSCTQSFDREPRSVITSYLGAVSEGDSGTAIECWSKDAYYDLDAGCSEVCLSRFYGTAIQIQNISLATLADLDASGSQITALVAIACAGSDETNQAEILLESSASNLPWRHWKIVHSDFGGTNAEPWCR